MLKYLALSNKGLTSEELEKLTNLAQPQLKVLQRALSPVILQVDGCFRLYSYYLIKTIIIEIVGKDNQLLCKDVSEILNAAPSSVRKLEEHIHVLTEAKEWFQLKQIVSNIENFLIVFNPVHKYILGKCWENLIGQNYDPVIEYNKSLELFEMHYQPTIENLARIVLQLSRFFKELVDFEASLLTEFRHPLIKNRLLTIEKKKDKIERLQKEKTSHRSEIREPERSQDTLKHEDSRIVPDDFSIDSNDSERLEHKLGTCKNHLESIGLLREVKHMKMYDKTGKCEILKGYEKSNVDIPAGLENYLKEFDEIIRQEDERRRLYPTWSSESGTRDSQNLPGGDTYATTLKKTGSILSFKSFSRAGTESNLLTRQQIVSQTDAANFGDMKGYRDNDAKCETDDPRRGAATTMVDYDLFDEFKQNIKLDSDDDNGGHRHFYFYKRWIWIMFPWACMSIDPKSIFSDQIHRCFSSDLHYIKVVDELEITHKAQLIAMEAKLKKKAVLEAVRGDCLIDEDLTKLDSELKLTERAYNIQDNLGGYGFFEGLSQVGSRRNTAVNLKNITEDLARKSLAISARKSVAELAYTRRQSTDQVSIKASRGNLRGFSELNRVKSRNETLFLTDLGEEQPAETKLTRVASSHTTGSQSQFRGLAAGKSLAFSKL